MLPLCAQRMFAGQIVLFSFLFRQVSTSPSIEWDQTHHSVQQETSWCLGELSLEREAGLLSTSLLSWGLNHPTSSVLGTFFHLWRLQVANIGTVR